MAKNKYSAKKCTNFRIKVQTVKIIIAVTNDLVTDQRVDKIAQFLIAEKAKVILVGRKLKKSLPLKSRSYNTFRFCLLFNKGPLFYAEYNIRLFFYLVFRQFDVAVANDLDTLPANFLATKLKKKKLVYDSHEYFTEVPELVNRPRVKKIWQSLEKKMLPHIKHAYTVSQPIADAYNRLYNIKMDVIYNYPYLNKQKEIHQTDLPDKNIIIYQGVLNKGRGLENLIAAMQYIDQAALVLVGDGDIAQTLNQQTEKLNLQERVIFTGRIPLEKVYSYTIKANIGVSLEENMGLNYYYAMPNKLFDYIHANVPVLVSALPEMENVVKKYDIGMVADNNYPKKLALLFNYMLAEEDKRSLWKKNLKIAAEELCWEKEEQKLKAIY